MKVLSLFDGISCGRVALERAGINVEKYYSSEIDKNAMLVSEDNYPDIIRLGDVRNVTKELINDDIDLVIFGSPCQGFSIAGKKLNFDDPRSNLFFEAVRILKELKPKYFLMENVKMDKEIQEVITETLREIYPDTVVYNINSKVMTAQLRNRFYWTNIQGVEAPEDKNILLKDILTDGYTEREKSRALTCGTHTYKDKVLLFRRYRTTGFGNLVFTTPDTNNNTLHRELYSEEMEKLQTLPIGYTKILDTVRKKSVVIGNGWTVDVIAHIFKNIK
jgi:DNA-cytosine methyltransferase